MHIVRAAFMHTVDGFYRLATTLGTYGDRFAGEAAALAFSLLADSRPLRSVSAARQLIR